MKDVAGVIVARFNETRLDATAELWNILPRYLCALDELRNLSEPVFLCLRLEVNHSCAAQFVLGFNEMTFVESTPSCPGTPNALGRSLTFFPFSGSGIQAGEERANSASRHAASLCVAMWPIAQTLTRN